MIHSSKLPYVTIKNFGTKLNGLFSVVSPLVMAVFIGCAGVWALEQSPSQTYIQTDQVILAHPGDTVRLHAPFVAQIEARKAVYRIWIDDEEGDRVYMFPDHVLINPRIIDLTELQDLTVPRSVKPGTYVLHVETIYPFNPFKNGKIAITAASIVVTAP